MVDAASKQNAFKALNNRFYHENAKSTMRNKRQDWKLAALGSKKITNYFISELKQKVKKNTQDIRLQYVAQYLRLVKSDFTKQEASNIISTSLNHGSWMAPSKNLFAFLYDEDIQNKMVQFLNSNKFELNISQICNYITDEIFPSVGIEVKKTI
ncbi:12836_t:CDS:2, partial [Cetraspora pellucida]